MDLEQLIADYQPTEQTKQLIDETKIVLLVGIAGAGKDTVKKALLSEPDFRDIVSHTTRAPRANNGVAEVADVDYHFIDLKTAEQLVKNKEFVEVKYVHGTIYGTSVAELKLSHDERKIAVTDIDVQGVAEYKDISSDVIAVFLIPPSYDIWYERLSHRYETHEAFIEEWPKRRDSAIRELTYALEVPYFHFVINDDLDRTIEVTNEIARRDDVFNRKDDQARLIARDLLEAIKQSQHTDTI